MGAGEGPSLFGVDGTRLTVAGSSAGGYLTLMSGFHVKPSPRALVAFWGYADITGSWYSRPDAFYNQQPAVPKEKVSRLWVQLRCRNPRRRTIAGVSIPIADRRDFGRRKWRAMIRIANPTGISPIARCGMLSADILRRCWCHGTKDTDVHARAVEFLKSAV